MGRRLLDWVARKEVRVHFLIQLAELRFVRRVPSCEAPRGDGGPAEGGYHDSASHGGGQLGVVSLDAQCFAILENRA